MISKKYYPMLKKSVMFCDFDDNELERFLLTVKPEVASYAKGEVILSQGGVTDRSGLIIEGSIIAEGVSYSGTRRTISTLVTGEMFGDVLIFSKGRKTPVSIIAREDTTVLFVSLDTLLRSESEPLCMRALLNMLGGIADKFWVLNRKIAYLSAKSLRTKTAMFLLDMQRRYSSDIFTVEYSREELSSLLSVNRSALSRELSRMQSEGIISFYKSSFKILDRKRLTESL